MMIKRLAYKRQQARCDTTRQANHMSRPTVEKSILHLVLAAYQAWGKDDFRHYFRLLIDFRIDRAR